MRTELSLSDEKRLRHNEVSRKSYHNRELKRDTTIYDKRRNGKVRREVLEYYSLNLMICDCCYEDNEEFLTIDHINGCGKELRKKQGEGTRLYHWIKRNNFPEGFRVLCYNCNCSSKRFGICPHKMELSEEH